MKYFDQHVHCYYSQDSKEPLENYIKLAVLKGCEYFVTTDHFDLNIANKNIFYIADFEKEKSEYLDLQNKFPNIKLMMGIEVGYKKEYLAEIIEKIKSQNFSIVNLSVHDYGNIDFYDKKEYIKYGIDKLIRLYFDICIDAVKTVKEYDVFSHFDYAFKCAKMVDSTIKIYPYENQVIELFKLIIESNKILEINTKVQEVINDDEYFKYVLKLYKKFGGKYLSLSSDAHKVDRFMSSFERYIPIIKECGFNELTIVINHKKHLVEI